jgi:hypothetical protein
MNLTDSLEGILTLNPQTARLNSESYSLFCLGAWYTYNMRVTDPNNANQQVVSLKDDSGVTNLTRKQRISYADGYCEYIRQ